MNETSTMHPVKLGKYKHFKGGEYIVIANSINIDFTTPIPVVIYKYANKKHGTDLFVRTTTNFTELITEKNVRRFEYIGPVEKETFFNGEQLLAMYQTLIDSCKVKNSNDTFLFKETTRLELALSIQQILKTLTIDINNG
jgi:hypothetical protein